MKMLKKIVAVVALLCTGAGAFALVHSDIQVQAGVTFTGVDFDDWDEDYDYRGLNLAVENYNLFDLNKVISLGFMEGLSLTAYVDGLLGSDFDAFGADFIVGPAVGVDVFDFVKFQGMAGIAGCFRSYDYDYHYWVWDGWGNRYWVGDDDSDDNFSVGFVTEVQGKFFPKNLISPVGGMRFIWTKSEMNSCDVDVTDFNIYGGLSFNLGI